MIQKRKVSSFMSFLGEAGGVHGSMIILGATIHALISGNEQSTHMLKHYFRIEESKQSLASASSFVSEIYQTVLQYLFYWLMCNKKCRRTRLLYKKTDSQLEQALDVRTLLRM